MSSGDIVAIIGATATLITAAAGAYALVRRRSDEMSKQEVVHQENIARVLRNARRIIRVLRDILSEHGIPEPEGIDEQLTIKRKIGADEEA